MVFVHCEHVAGHPVFPFPPAGGLIPNRPPPLARCGKFVRTSVDVCFSAQRYTCLIFAQNSDALMVTVEIKQSTEDTNAGLSASADKHTPVETVLSSYG